MSSAGQQFVGNHIPGERIDTAEETTDSADFTTTETVVMSLEVPLVDGRTYAVWATPGWQSSVAGDNVAARLREDDINGDSRQRRAVDIEQTGGLFAWSTPLFFEHTATSTGNKTFVVTGKRISGSGDCRLEAAATHPSYLAVDYIRG